MHLIKCFHLWLMYESEKKEELSLPKNLNIHSHVQYFVQGAPVQIFNPRGQENYAKLLLSYKYSYPFFQDKRFACACLFVHCQYLCPQLGRQRYLLLSSTDLSNDTCITKRAYSTLSMTETIYKRIKQLTILTRQYIKCKSGLMK